ncbi:MAG: hypothetical protein RSB10_04410 [Clostridia bacterium]
MKRKLLLLFVIMAIMVLTISAVACAGTDADGLKKLSIPTELEMNGSTVSWSAVDKAEKYYVSVNGEEVAVDTTTYNIAVSEIGEYAVKIRAYGDGVKYGSSDWSQPIVYVKGQRLATPKVTINNETKTASWTAVDNAAKYSIKIKNKQVSTDNIESGDVVLEQELTETSFVLSDEKFKAFDAYGVTVIAYPSADNKIYTKSLPSDMAKYIVSLKLPTPQIKAINESSLSWDKIDNAIKYNVVVESVGKETKIFATTGTAYSFSTMKLGAGKYNIRVQAVGDGVVFFDSDISAVNPDYSVQQLAQIDKTYIEYVKELDSVTNSDREYIKITFPTLSALDGIDELKLLLKAVKADGNTSLRTLDTKVAIVADQLEYKISLDEVFFTLKKVTDKETYEQDFKFTEEENYSSMFEISVYAINNKDNKIFDSGAQVLEQKYRSYKAPRMHDDPNDTAFNGYYIIENLGNLSYMEKYPNQKYYLAKNLDFNYYEFRSIKEFGGVFDGRNHTISNMVITNNGDSDTIAFIQKVAKGGTIQNLHLVNLNAKGYKNTAIVGGMVGVNDGSITNSTVNGNIDINYFVNTTDKDAKKFELALAGGLVGENNGSIANCQSNVAIKANAGGGLVGKNAGGISYSMSIGKVDAQLADETYTGEVTFFAGGLVGENIGTVLHCFAIGNVSATGKDAIVGGLIAINSKVANIDNSGVVAQSYSGKPFTKETRERVTAKTSGNNSIAGGLIGKNSGTIRDCYSTVFVTATSCAGGLVGENSGTINTAYSTGGTDNSGAAIGGFVGRNSGSVVNAYYYSESNKVDAGNATKIIDASKLATDLATLLQAGNATTEFANMQDGKNPVLKQMIYISDYNITIKQAENISLKGKLVTPDGATVELGKGIGETFKLHGSDLVAGKIIAQYSYGINTQSYISIYVFVTVK